MWQLCFVEWDSEYWARPAQIFNLGLGIPMASSPLATMEVGRRYNSSFVFKMIKGVLVGLRILLGVTALWRRNSFPGANCLFLILLEREISWAAWQKREGGVGWASSFSRQSCWFPLPHPSLNTCGFHKEQKRWQGCRWKSCPGGEASAVALRSCHSCSLE